MRTLVLSFLFLLGACTSPIETRIESFGLADREPTSFAPDAKANGVFADAQAIVANRLAEKGFRMSETAELNLQVTVSDRPAKLELKNGTKLLSPVVNKKRCAKRDYRVGITLTRIADGAVLYQGRAAEFHCKQALADVLGSLVSSALNDLGAPRGSYTVKRPR